MNPECFEQLTDGYEEAINSVSDLTDTLSDLQETLIFCPSCTEISRL